MINVESMISSYLTLYFLVRLFVVVVVDFAISVDNLVAIVSKRKQEENDYEQELKEDKETKKRRNNIEFFLLFFFSTYCKLYLLASLTSSQQTKEIDSLRGSFHFLRFNQTMWTMPRIDVDESFRWWCYFFFA